MSTNPNVLQALFEQMSRQMQEQRAGTQMTLGYMIEILDGMGDAEVANLTDPHSYRGYYEDLAFEPSDGTRTAKSLADECRRCMGQVFVGYKGGDFVMDALTPVWVSEYGCLGRKLMMLHAGGAVDTEEDE